ncbi:MAG: indole-3-glycerol phosphate synthase TrpC [Pseudomonadota bacterium]
MSTILAKILATKQREVAEAKRHVPLEMLHDEIAKRDATKDFVGAIAAKHGAGIGAKQPAVIAEIKKQSPSAGRFRADDDFDVARFAASYEANGAACLSVLTDHDYFGGTAGDLRAARAACELPILRKDFIVDPYQIVEARAMGADAVLFIVDVVPIDVFREWEKLATALSLAVLIESHTESQIRQAITLATPLIGINNRDLTRFETHLDTTLKLAPLVGVAKLVVSESGIESPQAIDLMMKNGILTFLVGGALMKTKDPGAALGLLFRDKFLR